MDRRPEVVDKIDAPRLPRHRLAIEFHDVTFGYIPDRPVIRGLNLKVRHGETIALVGPNGSGKSTLMNLLPRLGRSRGGHAHPHRWPRPMRDPTPDPQVPDRDGAPGDYPL